MVGFPIDKNVLDARVGSLTMGLRDTLRQISAVKAWLDGQADVVLTGFGYSTDDVTLLRSSLTDLDKLAQIAHAQAAQAQPNDFFFWAGRLLGLS